MELKDFIKETLTNILEGVKASQEVADQNNALVVPYGVQHVDDTRPFIISGQARMYVEFVEFEVVLTESVTKANEKGIGVLFGSVGLGGKTNAQNEHDSVTSIKFKIPVRLPYQFEKKK